jgi:hypothetical protein
LSLPSPPPPITPWERRRCGCIIVVILFWDVVDVEEGRELHEQNPTSGNGVSINKYRIA